MNYTSPVIAVIGAGKLAHSVVHALVKKKYFVSCIISRNKKSAKELASKNRIKNYSDKLTDIPSGSNVFLFTVPDDQLKIVGRDFCKLFQTNNSISGNLFIHFSGVESTEVLKPLRKYGADTASFHIMQSFPSKNLVDIEACYAAIETDQKQAKRFLYKIAKSLSLKPFDLEPDEKNFYHLAGVFASNFISGNFYNSEDLLASEKPDKAIPPIVLKKTTETTLENIFKLGASSSLSGPVDRGDIDPVKRHIELLKKLESGGKKRDHYRLLKLSYIVQSLLLIELCRKKYKNLNAGHKKIKKYLEEELKQAL